MNARQGNEQQVSVRRERILEVLRGALTAEAVAQGAARRRAYRVTRHLLGGAVQSGLSRGYIAQQLGLNVSSMGSRITLDEIVPAAAFAELARIPVTQIAAWQTDGRITLRGPDAEGDYGYLAAELFAALASHDGSQASVA